MAKVNEDLQRERSKCSFNVEELTNYIDGGVKNTNYRRKLESNILQHKELFDNVSEEYLSHKDKYENSIRKGVLFYRLQSKYQHDNNDQSDFEKTRANHRDMISTAVFKDNSPFTMQFSMFVPAILGLASKAQQAYWLKRATNFEIIGTYAQTELGHGTFIRGLETTATYDPDKEQFILHSPTLTSYKWWPGGMAHTANYSIVMAHLFIKGKSYGIQPFMVQLRDEQTHMPLEGIKLGEIGAKFGFNTVNNGFLGFENHRIPRNRMLMKNVQVLKDGTFVQSANSKLTYGAMVLVRVMIVTAMAKSLMKSATIAVRYSAVRRQSQMKPNESESQILDYFTQQHKLFIAIASSHAFLITAWWLWDLNADITAELEKGNLERLPEVHALSCCLKAVSSADSAVIVERCRLACGGHGYMHSSNLPFTYALTTAACTYEGENTVLMLQTARSLIKAWQRGSKGSQLCPTETYLMDNTPLPLWKNSVDGIIDGFRRVSSSKVKNCVLAIDKLMKTGSSYEDAWNQTSVRLVSASEAHCRVIILTTYKSEVDRASQSMSAPLAKVMRELVQLYAIYWALEKIGDFLLYTSLTERDVQELHSQYEMLLKEVRHNAVGLVDAFDIRDEILNSTLGAYDGRVYERLMEEALKSPLNSEPVNQSFHKYLKPFMQGKL